jgi:hypothetical protein
MGLNSLMSSELVFNLIVYSEGSVKRVVSSYLHDKFGLSRGQGPLYTMFQAGLKLPDPSTLAFQG